VGPDVRRRAIGPAGTLARAALGATLLASVIAGQAARGWHPDTWLLGLIGLPSIPLLLLWLRARRRPSRLVALGPLGHLLTLLAFLSLYLTFWYAPALRVTSDAALIFFGGSLVLAALRGDGGCEVLSATNWLLRRDDRLGCILFAPLDRLERRDRTRCG
jgi:hypothetical protein